MERVRVQKREYSNHGGDVNDETMYVTEIDPNEDSIDARGISIQSDSSDDATVEITRTNTTNKMTFKDAENTTPVPLTDLVAGAGGLTSASHETEDVLVHLIAETSHFDLTYNGSGDLTSAIYYTDSGKTTKIREYALTYNEDDDVSQVVETQYDSGGSWNEKVTYVITYDSDDNIDYVELTKAVP
jgi:hypothetical protein